MRRTPTKLLIKYKRLATNRLFPLATAEIDGLRFRYLRADSPPQDPENLATGFEFHRHINELHGEVAIDIGANIGSYTLPLAKRFRNVTAFEPSHIHCRVLRINISLNKLQNVHVYEVALSEVNGMMPLYVRGGGATSLDIAHYDLKYDKVSIVKVARLDDFRSKFDRLDFMKVDAEGVEGQILRGGREVISEMRPVLAIEVHKRRVPSGISCSCDVCCFVQDLAYKVDVVGEYSSAGHVHWIWAVPKH